MNFGNMVRDGGRLAGSQVWFGKAIDTLRPLHQSERQHAIVTQVLRNSHWGRASACDQLGQYAEAVRDWDRAVELSPKGALPVFRVYRATSQVNAGFAAEAVEEVTALRKLTGWNESDWYSFACVYSAASARMTDKKAEYTDAAVEMLQKAVKAGYRDVARITRDKALDPIRARDEFNQLLAHLEKKYPPKREVLPAPRKE